MNDDELERSYRAGMRRPEAAPRDGPDPALLMRVAQGNATEAERLQVLDQVMQSESLRKEYDTMRAVATAARGAPSRWPRLLAAAAVLLLAGGAVLWQYREPADAWRGGEESVEIVSPRDDAVVLPPVTLAWRATPGAHGYDVELLAEDGRLMARLETADTVWVVPDSAGLLRGAGYRWAVAARLADGRSRRSPTARFTLQR